MSRDDPLLGILDVVVRARFVREDLNDPHAAAMWDSRTDRERLVCRKDLKDPHAAAMWDSRTMLRARLLERT
jgi:hypothetical protein